jgi:hypothetical protein
MRHGTRRPDRPQAVIWRGTSPRAVSARTARQLIDDVESTSNVLQFPVGDTARARLAFGQVRLHVNALEHELQILAEEWLRTPGEWARHAAIPLVRTECISRYLMAVIGSAAASAGGWQRSRMHEVREELQAAVSAIATVLARLGDPKAGQAERRQALRDLPLLARRQKQILAVLGELVEEAY